MKKSLYGLLVCSLLLFTGCIDIVEELFLNKDGSGKYSIRMDMSALMADGGLKSMMEGMMEGDSVSAKPDQPMEQDTIMYMSDAPDSIRQRFVHPELMDRMNMRIVMSEKQEKMLFSFNFDFNKVSEINDFLEDMDKMQGGNDKMGALSGGSGLLPSVNGAQKIFAHKKCLFNRYPAPKNDDSVSEEDMAMAKMMFQGATYKTIYHFPGKVKKVSNKNAVIDGKTVTLETSLADIMDKKADLDMEVKFKKR